jgi:hypothetical protein
MAVFKFRLTLWVLLASLFSSVCIKTCIKCNAFELGETRAIAEVPAAIEQLQGLKQCWQDVEGKFSEVGQLLENAKIVYGVPLGDYDTTIMAPNENKIVLLESQSYKSDGRCGPRFIKAIFKPRGHAHQKVELAAFKIAEYLGLNLVPPTVKAEFEGKLGIISYFVDTSVDINLWKERIGLEQIKAIVSPESLNNYYAFCFVFGMWDLKWVNILLVGTPPHAHILSIDNESLLTPVHAPFSEHFLEHFYVCWKQDPLLVGVSPYSDLENFKPEILCEQDIPQAYGYLKRFFTQDMSIKNLGNPEAIKHAIMGRIKAFMWGKKQVNHYVGNKCWWLQLYGGIPRIPVPHVIALSDYTKKQLELLTVSKLRELFDDLNSTGAKPSFSDEHYEAILKRRDLVLATIK